MSAHGVRIVQLSADEKRAVLCQCLCGAVAGMGLGDGILVDPNAPRQKGSVVLRASILYTGHFHSGATPRVPVGDVDLSLRPSVEKDGEK